MTRKLFNIHRNYLRPFVVEVEKNRIIVYRASTFKVILKAPYDDIFIGKRSPKGGYDGLTEDEAIGNTILIRAGRRYTYIGDEIYSFHTVDDEVITKYYSDIGNNDVPYPYAMSKKNIYIMLDRVAVPKSDFDPKRNIYGQYYADQSKKDKDKDKDPLKLKHKVLVKRDKYA